MKEKMQIKAVEMVRRIRDEQARMLSGKSKSEVIAFFRKAGEDARQAAKKKQLEPSLPQFDGKQYEQKKSSD
jgi:hypothetical protein